MDNNNIKYIKQKTFKECKDIKLLKFDFYLPEYNMCIEFDGIQHFKPIERFGGIDGFKKTKQNDKTKNIYCDKNNIKLLRIKYNENIFEKIISKLYDKRK